MFSLIKRKKSTIDSSQMKYTGDENKCLNVGVNQQGQIISNSISSNNLINNSQINKNIGSTCIDSTSIVSAPSDKSFNSKNQSGGASEIYGNNMESTSKFSKTQSSHSIKRIVKKMLTLNKKKDVDPKLCEYIKLIDYHKEFFKRSPEIDKYVLTLSYIYLKKAFPEEYITSELFFYSLYLAWETEEDSTLGLESIIHYVIGSYPSSKNKEKNQRKQEIIEWRMRLREFHNGKDILWKALDYKTVVDYPNISKVLKTFPSHDILKRDRTNTTSIKFF
ncbi:hypothetical protein CYY_003406 [Polysphondylium violaceum]|uniref:Uncharacterized protein n=1 Tax=Polysphondylium violaceum TaxID=133409 RepID=A0A8J4PWV7_9MYCE|nr:hypothetical protein CYY_003406 [Polysphondylium violaceum]